MDVCRNSIVKLIVAGRYTKRDQLHIRRLKHEEGYQKVE